MADKINKDPSPAEYQDSLVDALESIKNLLAQGDSKLAAARDSISKASHSSRLDKPNISERVQQASHAEPQSQNNQPTQLEIPVLNDIVISFTADDSIPEAVNIAELIPVQSSIETERVLTPVEGNIPTLTDSIENPGAEIILNYIDQLQEKIENTLNHSLMKNMLSIEEKLKQALAIEIDHLREQVIKSFS
jgi:hypothetical protein